MASLLEYSAKQEQLLQDYCAALLTQVEDRESWVDDHIVAIVTNHAEVMLRDTLNLYVTLLRADEFHHYSAVTTPDYPYEATEGLLTNLFEKFSTLLDMAIQLIERAGALGITFTSADDIRQCLHEVKTLRADESPVYESILVQGLLQRSLDDIKEGRVHEMTPERL